MVYLMKMERQNGTAFKVGYTAHLKMRMLTYKCHNPFAECISTVETYHKTKRALENAIHAEIKAMGFEFYNNTEWFIVEDNAKAREIAEHGLAIFKSCKNRKVMG